MVKLTRADGQQLSDIACNRRDPWGKRLYMRDPVSNKRKEVNDPGGFKVKRHRNGDLLKLEYGNKEVLFTDEPEINADKIKSTLAHHFNQLPPSRYVPAMGEKELTVFLQSRFTGIGITVWVRANLQALRAHIKACLDVAQVNSTENLRRIDETARQVDTHQGRLDTHQGRLDTHQGRLDTHQGRLETFAEDNARDREAWKAEREANDAKWNAEREATDRKFFGALDAINTHTHQIGQLQVDSSTHTRQIGQLQANNSTNTRQIRQLQARVTNIELNGPSGDTAAQPAPAGPAVGSVAHPAADAPSTLAAAAPVARAPLPFGIPAKHRTFERFN